MDNKTTRISSILNPAIMKWRDFPFRGISLDGNMQISYIWRIQWGYSSVGRATGSQSVGHGFDSHYLHAKEASKRLPLLFSTDTRISSLKAAKQRPHTSWPLNIPLGTEFQLSTRIAFSVFFLVILGQFITLILAVQSKIKIHLPILPRDR